MFSTYIIFDPRTGHKIQSTTQEAMMKLSVNNHAVDGDSRHNFKTLGAAARFVARWDRGLGCDYRRPWGLQHECGQLEFHGFKWADIANGSPHDPGMTFKAELLSEPLQVAWRKKEIKTPGAVYDYNLVAYCDGEQVGRIYHDRPREQEGFCGGIIRMFQPHVESNNKWLSKAETLADAKAALVAVLQADQAEMVEANKIISTLIFGQPALRGG